MILKVLVMYFQKLFTESKKLSRLSCSGATKLALTRTFSVKCMEKSAKILTFFTGKCNFLAPDHFLSPTFGMVVPSNESYKRYLGIFEIEIFALFGDLEVEKISIFRKKVNFLTFSAPKMGLKLKISENAK